MAVMYEWEEESCRLFDTFGAHLDRLADFEEAGLKPCSFGQGLMQVPQDNLYIPTIDVPTRPEYFPSAFFIYAIRVLQGRAGLSDLGDVHLRRKVQECISSTPEVDYDIGNEASHLVSVKLDEEILDPVDEPEVARLIKVGAVPEQVCRHEPLDPDTLTKLFREESLRVSVQGSRPLQPADDGLPGPYELFEPFLHFKPVEWLVTKASWEAEPLSTHSSRPESGEPNETRSV